MTTPLVTHAFNNLLRPHQVKLRQIVVNCLKPTSRYHLLDEVDVVISHSYTPNATMIKKAIRLTVAIAISLVDSFGATHKSFAV